MNILWGDFCSHCFSFSSSKLPDMNFIWILKKTLWTFFSVIIVHIVTFFSSSKLPNMSFIWIKKRTMWTFFLVDFCSHCFFLFPHINCLVWISFQLIRKQCEHSFWVITVHIVFLFPHLNSLIWASFELKRKQWEHFFSVIIVHIVSLFPHLISITWVSF